MLARPVCWLITHTAGFCYYYSTPVSGCKIGEKWQMWQVSFPSLRVGTTSPTLRVIHCPKHTPAARYFFFSRTPMCNSTSCFSLTGLGASSSRSVPIAVLGKAITSRMLVASA